MNGSLEEAVLTVVKGFNQLQIHLWNYVMNNLRRINQSEKCVYLYLPVRWKSVGAHRTVGSPQKNKHRQDLLTDMRQQEEWIFLSNLNGEPIIINIVIFFYPRGLITQIEKWNKLHLKSILRG